jgi:hypothetical protein
MLHVTDVQPTGEYRLWLRFSDGTAGQVDLTNELDGPMFEPLRNVDLFAQVCVDPEIRTVAWPNGADFAPEFLRERVRAKPLCGCR